MMQKMLALILLIVLLGACSKPKAISQAEVEKLAAVRLEEYVKKEKLSLGDFGNPEIRYTEKDAGGKDLKAWEVYYTSKNKPIYRVNILVGLHGDIELHQMVDNK